MKKSEEANIIKWAETKSDEELKEILNNKLKDNIDEFKEYIGHNDCPIILLNIVLNDINFTQCNYANIIAFANRFKLHYKEECII